MKPSFLYQVRTWALQINNGRELQDIYDHAKTEMVELKVEIETDQPGEDGITGEAMDVILCMMDLIIKQNPSITDAEFSELAERKLRKWHTHYKDSIHRQR